MDLDFEYQCPEASDGHDFVGWPDRDRYASCIYCGRALDADRWDTFNLTHIPLLDLLIEEDPG